MEARTIWQMWGARQAQGEPAQAPIAGCSCHSVSWTSSGAWCGGAFHARGRHSGADPERSAQRRRAPRAARVPRGGSGHVRVCGRVRAWHRGPLAEVGGDPEAGLGALGAL